jgi:hypothetical protein
MHTAVRALSFSLLSVGAFSNNHTRALSITQAYPRGRAAIRGGLSVGQLRGPSLPTNVGSNNSAPTATALSMDEALAQIEVNMRSFPLSISVHFHSALFCEQKLERKLKIAVAECHSYRQRMESALKLTDNLETEMQILKKVALIVLPWCHVNHFFHTHLL